MVPTGPAAKVVHRSVAVGVRSVLKVAGGFESPGVLNGRCG